MTKKPKTLRNAVSDKAVALLERDNFSVGPKSEWMLSSNGEIVHLSQQRYGEARKQSFEIPKAHFNALIDAYMAEQPDTPTSKE